MSDSELEWARNAFNDARQEMRDLALALDMGEGKVGSIVQVSPGVIEWERFVRDGDATRKWNETETAFVTERIRTTFTHEVSA